MNIGGIVNEIWPDAPATTSVDLEQLVLISLFSDARALDDDVLPDTFQDPPYKGGWWADAYAADSDKFGSRLWLLNRAVLRTITLDGLLEHAYDALQWMVDDDVCSRVVVTAERIGKERIEMVVTVYKLDGEKVTIKHDALWE